MFRKEISVKDLKVAIEFNANFPSMILKYTLSAAMSVF